MTTFPTVASFQDHFTKNHSLRLPANTPLVINGIYPHMQMKISPLELKEIQSDHTLRRVLACLERLLLPLGLQLSFHHRPLVNFVSRIEEDFYLSSPQKALLTATQGPIQAPLSHLFQSMALSSLTTIEVDGLVLTGINKEKLNSAESLVTQLAEAAVSPPFTYMISPQHLTIAWKEDASSQPSCLIVKAAQPIRISLHHYRFSLESFSKFLLRHEKLKIPPNQHLIIEGDFDCFWKGYKGPSDQRAHFALEQSLTLHKKNVTLTPCLSETTSDQIKLWSAEGFTIKLSEGSDFRIDLQLLAQNLLASQKNEIAFEPGQSFLFSIDEGERKLFERSQLDGFCFLVLCRAPIGFAWHLNGSAIFSVTHSFLKVQNGDEALEMTLALRPADLFAFAFSLINEATLSFPTFFLPSLLKRELSALHLTVFCALHHICLDLFKKTAPPRFLPFLSIHNQVSLKLLALDNTFVEHIRRVSEDKNLAAKFHSLCSFPLHEFTDVDFNQFEEPIAYIGKSLNPLVEAELDQTPLKQAILEVIQYFKYFVRTS